MELKLTLICVMIVLPCVEDISGTCPRKSFKGVAKLKRAQDRSTMVQEFMKLNVTLEFEISPEVFIVNLGGTCTDKEADVKITSIKNQFPKKVNSVERVRIYEDTLMPGSSNKYELLPTNLVCDHYYGMGVEQVWDQGITGKGVKISVLDVGVNTDLEEFKHSVNKRLSYNYAENTWDVTPEYYEKSSKLRSPLTDHGNQICSIIAAAKGNGLCSAGISHGSTLAVRKIFSVTNEYGTQQLHPNHWTSSDVIAKAIVENATDISEIIMAWSPVREHYDLLDLATQEAVKTAAKVGRNGLGTLMFTPAGVLGYGMANNIHTITVGGMSKDGRIPDSLYGDASVIVCGLTDGTNLTSSKMVTTTLYNRCVTGFAGVSAATAQVGAISALALEANPRLSLRDAQHILVRTSDYQGLVESRDFKQNGAGLFFHGIFGFGKANATKLVALAKTWETVSPLFMKTLNALNETRKQSSRKIYMFNYVCMETDPFCLEKLEHVEVKMKLSIKAKSLGMAIVSPSGTTSVLIDPSIKQMVSDAWKEVQLITVHFWDEKPIGDWKVKLKFHHREGSTEIGNINITLYGTGVENTMIQQQITKPAATTTPRKTPNKTVNRTETKKSNANVLFSNLSLMMVCFFATYILAIYGQ